MRGAVARSGAPTTWSRTSLVSLEPKESPPARRRLGHVAATVFAQDIEPHYCLVTDVSEGCVLLHVKTFDVPDVFALLFHPDGPAYSGNYKVVWRHKEEVAAKFVGAV